MAPTYDLSSATAYLSPRQCPEYECTEPIDSSLSEKAGDHVTPPTKSSKHLGTALGIPLAFLALLAIALAALLYKRRQRYKGPEYQDNKPETTSYQPNQNGGTTTYVVQEGGQQQARPGESTAVRENATDGRQQARAGDQAGAADHMAGGRGQSRPGESTVVRENAAGGGQSQSRPGESTVARENAAGGGQSQSRPAESTVVREEAARGGRSQARPGQVVTEPARTRSP